MFILVEDRACEVACTMDHEPCRVSVAGIPIQPNQLVIDSEFDLERPYGASGFSLKPIDDIWRLWQSRHIFYGRVVEIY